ncbi:profilin, required for normal timing of actin polymerization in response to thermal stress [Verticillium nonalfalfae]|uniref:Profilin n=1 Tax=Verticillium nonalfalfae TaxID=1051616 RepID=A0A3M9XZY1_9PEZI|nr:profilin, required for normal timing of actin polymerization in response to thermal stress [Verticillium nonalfalfae]RNJ53827.1 profilin, required for normal timing of actin polymerization in response to thermal stress [Verticillium nonalfalfae]
MGSSATRPMEGLVGTGHIDKAAIVSIAGDSVWATSAGFTVSPTEMKAIADVVTAKPGAADKAFGDGLYVAGERYVMARAEDGTIYARKGREGIAIAKTNQAILIGHHGEAAIAGNASAAVQKLADYLIGLSY